MRPRKHHLQPGDRYGRLTVIDAELHLPVTPGKAARGCKAGNRAALVACDCGAQAKIVPITDLTMGRTVSCSCHKSENLSIRSTTHGLTVEGTATRWLYFAWSRMMDRCYNIAYKDYASYGGRGIDVCERWHSRIIFIQDVLAELGLRPEGLTLDRINNNEGYRPGNIRYATLSEQVRNRRPISEWRHDAPCRCVVCRSRLRRLRSAVLNALTGGGGIIMARSAELVHSD